MKIDFEIDKGDRQQKQVTWVKVVHRIQNLHSEFWHIFLCMLQFNNNRSKKRAQQKKFKLKHNDRINFWNLLNVNANCFGITTGATCWHIFLRRHLSWMLLFRSAAVAKTCCMYSSSSFLWSVTNINHITRIQFQRSVKRCYVRLLADLTQKFWFKIQFWWGYFEHLQILDFSSLDRQFWKSCNSVRGNYDFNHTENTIYFPRIKTSAWD